MVAAKVPYVGDTEMLSSVQNTVALVPFTESTDVDDWHWTLVSSKRNRHQGCLLKAPSSPKHTKIDYYSASLKYIYIYIFFAFGVFCFVDL